MSSYKNLYGIKEDIYFGDCNDLDIIYYDTQTNILTIGSQTGKYTKKIAKKISQDWDQYKKNYYYNNDLNRWFKR